MLMHRTDAQLDFEGGRSEGHTIHRVIAGDISVQATSGYFRVHGITVDTTMPCEEVFICIEGSLTVTIDGRENKMNPGDYIWLPKGIEISVEGENAVAFYCTAPS